MDSAAKLILKMNEMTDSDDFRISEFKELLSEIKDLCNPSFKLLDFEWFNERMLARIRKRKIKCIRVQDFITAAKIRDEEKECLAYIEIRAEYGIEKSHFYLDQGYLFYFYLGTSKNDKKLKRIFLKRI